MEHQLNIHPFVSTKIRPLCFSSNDDTIAVGQDSNQLLLINKANLSVQTSELTGSSDRVACIRITDKLLARGGNEGILSLWDNRQLGNGVAIHTFNRPGCKFKAIDISEHILAAGTSKRIIFWDLRKMKQRCEFTESFNEDVTALQFSRNSPTTFFASSCDGLISKFDLKEKNQQQAFLWGHKIIESPCHLQIADNLLLVQTQDQVLLTLEEQSLKDRYVVNSVENPTHILNSSFGTDKLVHYYTRNMKNNAIDYWIGKNLIGFVPTSVQAELLVPIGQKKAVFSDEQGNWFYEQVHHGKNYEKKAAVNKDFLTVEQCQLGQNNKKQEQSWNNNGFIISKPTTLKSNHKKFKPY